MTDWYYHAPGQGRVGPLDAEQMRACFRDRSIDRDTLAWHAGLREWQPVERLIEELGLTGVRQDTSLPPPVPPRPSAALASHAGPMRDTPPPPSNRSGCLIAAIVLGACSLVVLSILAAIAIPTYQDYVKRSEAARSAASAPSDAVDTTGTFDAARLAATEALARELVAEAMRQHDPAQGQCPDTFHFESLQARRPRLQGSREGGWFGLAQARPQYGRCAYEVSFYGLGREVLGRSVRYEVRVAGEAIEVDCHNGTLPPGHLPPMCHDR